MNDNALDATPPAELTPAGHHWKFFRAGGFDQVRLDTGADLLALKELDPKLWVALSSPVKNIEFPAETLACLDADKDGHVRIPELLAAIDWCAARIKNMDLLLEHPAALPLAAIDLSSEAGQKVFASARRILANLGTPEATAIDANAVADPAKIFGQTAFNGDGVITSFSTQDPDLVSAIACIGEVFGTKIDRSGESGIDADAITGFFNLSHQWLDWQQARPDSASADQAAPMAAAMAHISGKIDDYFTRCRLAAYDPRAALFVNGSDAELDGIGRSELTQSPDALVTLPIARVEAGRALPLSVGVNPAWSDKLSALVDGVIKPLLGAQPESLDEASWNLVKSRATPLIDWYAMRPELPAGFPETDTLKRWINEDLATRLQALVAQDLALADEVAGIEEVRQLALYVRDLARFAHNFVSFRDFYNRKDKAVFQAGTLFLDGRSCELVVPVDDIGKHVTLATLAKLYLVYCECRRGEEKRLIAAAMTDGDSDQLLVGRNGVFVDRTGNDWNATIVRLVEHPISLRQAFWAPLRRISRMISEQLQKVAASKEQSVEKKANAAIADAITKGPAQAPAGPTAKAAPAPFDVAKFAGIFAAIGLALGAIGTVFASLLTAFISLKWWQMPLAIGGLFMIVSGPSMIVAWFKLRNRTLGPLLDANGWAINARAVINLPFGRSLTELARLPDHAERALFDPYAEKPTPWGTYIFLLALLGLALYFLITMSGK